MRLITEVDKKGPAEKAGMLPGDIVLKFDGEAVQISNDLPRFVANTKPGIVSTIELWRRGQRKIIDVTIEERQSNVVAKKQSVEEFPIGDVGLVVRELSAEEEHDLNIDNGLFITNAEGEAARAGLMEGDVILAVNDDTVTGAKQFQARFTGVGRIAALLVGRRNMVIYIPLRVKSD